MSNKFFTSIKHNSSNPAMIRHFASNYPSLQIACGNDLQFLEYLESKDVNYEILEKGSSLKICSLYDNKADIYPRFGPTSEWDIAAAHAVLSSAGGSIIGLPNMEELAYAKKSSILNPYFIAFRNEAIKGDFLPLLGDFIKKLV